MKEQTNFVLIHSQFNSHDRFRLLQSSSAWIVGSCYSSPILDLEKKPYDLNINLDFVETSMGNQETKTTTSSEEKQFSQEKSDEKSAIYDSSFSLENNKSDFISEYLPRSIKRGHDRFSPFERIFLTDKYRQTTPRAIHFQLVDEGMKSVTSIDQTKHIKNNSHRIPVTSKSAFKDTRPTLELFRDLPLMWERELFSPLEIMFYSEGQRQTTNAPHIHKKKQPHANELLDQLYFHGPSLFRQKTNRSFQLPLLMGHSEVIFPRKNASFIDLNSDLPYDSVPWMSDIEAMQKLLNDFVTIISKDIEGKTVFRESLPKDSDGKLNPRITNGDLISDILLSAKSNVPVHHRTRRASVKNIGILDDPNIITKASSFQAPFIENILKYASNLGIQNDGLISDVMLSANSDVPGLRRTRRDTAKNISIADSFNSTQVASHLKTTDVLGNSTLSGTAYSTEKSHSNLPSQSKLDMNAPITTEHVSKSEVQNVNNITTASAVAENNSTYHKEVDDKNIKSKIHSGGEVMRSSTTANDSKIEGGVSDKNRQVELKSAELGSVNTMNDSIKETRAINLHKQGKLKSGVHVAVNKTDGNVSSTETVATGDVKQVGLGSDGSKGSVETEKTEANVTYIQRTDLEKSMDVDEALGRSIDQPSLDMARKLSNESTITEESETQINYTESHIMQIVNKPSNESTSNPATGEDSAKFAKENIKTSPESTTVRYYIAGSVLPVVVGVFIVVALYIVRQNKRTSGTRPCRNRVAAAEMKEIVHEPMRAQVC